MTLSGNIISKVPQLAKLKKYVCFFYYVPHVIILMLPLIERSWPLSF